MIRNSSKRNVLNVESDDYLIVETISSRTSVFRDLRKNLTKSLEKQMMKTGSSGVIPGRASC